VTLGALGVICLCSCFEDIFHLGPKGVARFAASMGCRAAGVVVDGSKGGCQLRRGFFMRTGEFVVQIEVSASCNEGRAHQQTANKTPPPPDVFLFAISMIPCLVQFRAGFLPSQRRIRSADVLIRIMRQTQADASSLKVLTYQVEPNCRSTC